MVAISYYYAAAPWYGIEVVTVISVALSFIKEQRSLKCMCKRGVKTIPVLFLFL